jgi:hypothetical protein
MPCSQKGGRQERILISQQIQKQQIVIAEETKQEIFAGKETVAN